MGCSLDGPRRLGLLDVERVCLFSEYKRVL